MVGRGGLLQFIEALGDAPLKEWVEQNTTSPNAMVDRITPRPSPDVIERVQAATGEHDPAALLAESFIQWGAEKGGCIRITTMQAIAPPCDSAQGTVPIANALRDQDFYDAIVDAWSMRNWSREVQNGHDQFFRTFGKFGYAFANVNAVPELDREKATASFTFYIDPGRRVYVRKVNITGNIMLARRFVGGVVDLYNGLKNGDEALSAGAALQSFALATSELSATARICGWY